MNFRYRRLDPRARGIAVRSMPEMLYDVVRCTAVHEARLPANLQFTEEPVIQLGSDGELVLPIDVVYGLVMAIVGATTNGSDRLKEDAVFWFNGKTILVNSLWGDSGKIRRFIGIR